MMVTTMMGKTQHWKKIVVYMCIAYTVRNMWHSFEFIHQLKSEAITLQHFVSSIIIITHTHSHVEWLELVFLSTYVVDRMRVLKMHQCEWHSTALWLFSLLSGFCSFFFGRFLSVRFFPFSAFFYAPRLHFHKWSLSTDKLSHSEIKYQQNQNIYT